MPINVDLLAKICEVPGAPGFEKPIRDLVLKEIEGLADEIRVDSMGNVVALKKGASSEKKTMAAAHMDEIGFIVTHIDDKGFVRFNPLGGFDPKTLSAQRVIIHGREDVIGVMGSKPIHIMSPEERGKNVKLTDFFIDLGLPKSEVVKLVEVGDSITRERKLIEMGECVNVKSLDNRASVFLLVEALRNLQDKTPTYDFYAVFTVQEEVGLRGANASALEIQPDFGFGLDTTIAYDVPGSKPQERCTELGKGVGIKIMDSSTICDRRMVAFLKDLAGKEAITWQPEILAAGGTDTAGLQRMSPGGSIAGAISIPTRHIHQVIEMCHKSDLQGGIDLLVAAVCNLDSWDWSH
ncbi:M42 family metallopeptidase [Roseibacillus persicicus]|uniref:Peptidase M42 n=1 Tax=Roseibacillus persicicus TaxID=454148 RepID=A0A918TEM5_9BACT|nr:M42 family metallopeptidase [Roseibacillus persicicus]MDQ8190674.1 M42 family metallopeptidase [Roseibacillus persicicus]GHC41010.1 peptidase M42 [Roseibacillus persicicus]